MKHINKITLALFLGFIFTIAVINAATADKKFSESENRYLQAIPEFTFRKLFDGKFTQEFETYTNDQFPGRDFWVGLKCASELALGKPENNGVYITRDGYLLEKFDIKDRIQTDKNTGYINKFAESFGSPVNLMLIPNAVEILKNKLPNYIRSPSQKELLEHIKGALNSKVRYIDAFSILNEKKNEYIYYRTDHHWTSLGAFYGYSKLMESMGIKPLKFSDFEIKAISHEFIGTMYSLSGVRWGAKDRIDLYIPKIKNSMDITIVDDGSKMEDLYNEGALLTKDKYNVFLGGNHALITIKTSVQNDKKLLVMKDSYANSMIPFLTNHFRIIHVADMRYLKANMADYAKQNGITQVLVLYNLSNYTKDQNLVWIGS